MRTATIRACFWHLYWLSLKNVRFENGPRPRATFKLLSTVAEDTGKITASSLRSVCREAGVKFSEKEVKDMIEAADLNGDDAVDEDEFIAMMLKTNLF